MNVREAHGLRTSPGRNRVLTGVGPEIAAGDMVSMAGGNGSGKSECGPANRRRRIRLVARLRRLPVTRRAGPPPG